MSKVTKIGVPPDATPRASRKIFSFMQPSGIFFVLYEYGRVAENLKQEGFIL